MSRAAHYKEPEQAAAMLQRLLEVRMPGVQTVGVAEDEIGAVLIVYVLHGARIPEAVVPEIFGGYPVRVERVGRIRPAVAE